MRWRYQPVWYEQFGERCYELIEVHLDDEGKLESWTTDESPATPMGETTAELGDDIARMHIDTLTWEPVAYDALQVGMTFGAIIAPSERAALADFVNSVTVFLKGKGGA
jgi:hypothetical protein